MSVEIFNPEPAGSSGGGPPIGSIVMWPTATPPTDWLILDGSTFSAATYPDLNILLGGTTLPDMRGRFPFGVDAAGTGSTLLGTFGTKDHLHTQPTHTHTQPTHTHTGPSHDHTQPTHTHTQPTHTHTGPSHTHDVDIPPFATGGPSSTTPTQLILGAVASSSHTHTVNPPNTTSTAGGTGATGSGGGDNTGAGGGDTTGLSGTGATGASGGDTTGASGADNTGTANPPGLAFNFIIKAA